MYCVIDTRENKYYVGEFQQVINMIFKWYIKDDILYYKVRDYVAEEYDIRIEWFNDNQRVTMICNYLWNQLHRFEYIKFKQIN